MLNTVSFFFFLLLFLVGSNRITVAEKAGFVGRNGTQFLLNGEQVYLNGFNAYWMMTTAADTVSKGRATVTTALRQASAVGMNVARIWGFNEGDYLPLQISPGSYSEDVFKGLDFVVYEAGRYKIKLIISLVNNFEDYGGRKKYVEWAGLDEPDEFYTNSVVKQFYKNHVKTVLTRKNSITGRVYKEDPTIFSWELINEPRCNCSIVLQSWVKEMASYVKSIDSNHLLEIGLEGFYGGSKPDRTVYNPGGAVLTGTDFISNNQVPEIDFATIHIYPDSWLPLQSSRTGEQDEFVDKWIGAHIQDCDNIIKKPLLITEFGKSSKFPGFSLEERNKFFKRVYDVIYDSARTGGPCTGGVFWQLTTNRTGSLGDGYEVFMQQGPNTTASLIAQQSIKLRNLKYPPLVTHSAAKKKRQSRDEGETKGDSAILRSPPPDHDSARSPIWQTQRLSHSRRRSTNFSPSTSTPSTATKRYSSVNSSATPPIHKQFQEVPSQVQEKESVQAYSLLVRKLGV